MTGRNATGAYLGDVKQEQQIRNLKQKIQGIEKAAYIFNYTHISRISHWIFHKRKEYLVHIPI